VSFAVIIPQGEGNFLTKSLMLRRYKYCIMAKERQLKCLWEVTHEHTRARGFVPVNGYRVWYRIAGGSDHELFPLLILHGGPGAPHGYLENLEAMASDRRRVIFYDQLGCGRSDQPDDPSLCSVSRLQMNWQQCAGVGNLIKYTFLASHGVVCWLLSML